MQIQTFTTSSAMTLGVALMAVSAAAAPPEHAGGPPTLISECRVIDESGSYLLEENLPGGGGYLAAGDYAGAVDGDCILVVVSGVDLDLGGHVITGDGDSLTSGSGVHATTGSPKGEHINVYNGLITGFYRGVNFEGVFFSTLENITTHGNDNHGVSIHAGQSNHVRNNKSVDNGVAGFRVSTSSVVTNNIANGNGGVGLFVDERSVVSGNTAWFNNGDGVTVDCPSLVEGNVAADNGQVAGVDLELDGAGCVSVNNVFGTSSP